MSETWIEVSVCGPPGPGSCTGIDTSPTSTTVFTPGSEQPSAGHCEHRTGKSTGRDAGWIDAGDLGREQKYAVVRALPAVIHDNDAPVQSTLDDLGWPQNLHLDGLRPRPELIRRWNRARQGMVGIGGIHVVGDNDADLTVGCRLDSNGLEVTQFDPGLSGAKILALDGELLEHMRPDVADRFAGQHRSAIHVRDLRPLGNCQVNPSRQHGSRESLDAPAFNLHDTHGIGGGKPVRSG